ncbi:MAG: membrane protein insertase YidC [Salinivirgaceae bacterium]
MSFFELIIAPFLYIIEQLFSVGYHLTGNYGLSIVLLSFAISLLLLPVFILIEKAKKRDDAVKRRMQPLVDEIKRCYKGQERYYYLKTLNRQYNYSPLRALIPVLSLLLQIPFFVAAYKYLDGLEALKGVSFLFINDLSQPDGLLGSIHLLPILMTVINLITAWFYTRNGNTGERKQMLVVAAIFLVLLFNLPSGLVLYWTMNNVFSFLRLFVTNKEIFRNIDFSHPRRQEFYSVIQVFIKQHDIMFRTMVMVSVAYLFLTFLVQKDAISPFATHILQIIIALLFFVNIIYSFSKKSKPNRKWFKRITVVFWMVEIITILIWFIHSWTLNYLYLKLFLIFILTSHFVSLAFYKYIFEGRIISQRNDLDLKVQNSFLVYLVEPVLLILLVVVLAPLLIYLSSPDDFNGLVSHLLVYQLIIGSLLLLIFTLLFGLLKRWRESLSKGLKILLLMVIVFGFMYQKNLGIMRGYRLVNDYLLHVDLLVVITDLSLILVIIYSVHAFYRRFRYVFLILILSVLFVESISVLKGVKEQLAYEKVNYYQELPNPDEARERLENQFALSKSGQNILIFVIDGLSGFVFDEMLQEQPEYYELFDGFTWYKNTISCGSFTFPSVSGLIGGHQKTINQLNEDEEHNFRDKIQNTLLMHQKTFADAGYSTIYHKIPYFLNEISSFDSAVYEKYKQHIVHRNDLFTYRTNFVNDYATPEAKDAFSNIPHIKLDNILLMRLTFFKIAPYVIKKAIYDKHTKAAGKTSEKATEQRIVEVKWRYRVSDSYWSSIGSLINNNSEQSTIKILWTKTMNRRYHVNEHFGPPVLEISNRKYSGYSKEEGKNSAKYIFSKLSFIFEKMKSLDVYDNTTLIIVSDHGVHYNSKDSWDEKAIHPVLMIKENNEARRLKTSEQLMSNADVFSISTRAVFGKSFDVIESPLTTKNPRELIYWSTDHGDKNTLDEIKVPIHFGIRLQTGDDVTDKTTWDTVFVDKKN